MRDVYMWHSSTISTVPKGWQALTGPGGQDCDPLLWMQIISGELEMDTKLMSDCLMSLAMFEAWQEPLYLHLVTQAHALPLAAYGPKSLRQTYQVGYPACYLIH